MVRVMLLGTVILSAVVSAWGQETVPSTVVLDGFGSWRQFVVLAPPAIAQEDGAQEVKYKTSEHYWLNGSTPAPAAE